MSTNLKSNGPYLTESSLAMPAPARIEPVAASFGESGGDDDLSRRFRPGESFIQTVLLLCGAISILTTLGIVVVLTYESLHFFNQPEVTLREFFTNTVWQPRIGEFGMMPLLNATLVTSFIGMCVALPLGLASAVYLSEYASPRVRGTLKPILEVLAGIPTVVYGYFALTFITPALRSVFGTDVVEIYNTLAAGLVIGILIVPLVASMSEDALRAVPRALREASYGLGGTKLETATRIVVPAALSGISAAFIVAISRAFGETMVVAIAAGAGPKLTWNPFVGAETLTGHIARISGGDLSYDSVDYQSIFALALVLFVMTLVLNIVSRQIMRKYRQEYQ
jgi:phosphate transport system permease protein